MGNLIRFVLIFAACFSHEVVKAAAPVDFTTLEGKVLFGYQGWFDCSTSGSGGWTHWSKGAPTASTLTVDLYPDVSELSSGDLCKANGMTVGGRQAYLF